MSEITLVTAMQPTVERLSLFPQTIASVEALELPVRWAICLDGSGEDEALFVRDLLAKGSLGKRAKVLHLHGRSVGAAACRNFALAHVRTPFVSSLDDDDLLPVDSFSRRVLFLRHDPKLHWVNGWLQDMSKESELLDVWKHPLPVGYYEAGEVMRYWESYDQAFPMNTAGILMRTDSLRALGGWHGVPSAEDMGMVTRLTNAHAGVMLPEVTYHYRKHESQSLATKPFQAIEETMRKAIWDLDKLTRPEVTNRLLAPVRTSA